MVSNAEKFNRYLTNISKCYKNVQTVLSSNEGQSDNKYGVVVM